MAVLSSPSSLLVIRKQTIGSSLSRQKGLSFACPALTGKGTRFGTVSCKVNNSWLNWKRFHRSSRIHFVSCCAGLLSMGGLEKGIEKKQVWIWTQNKQVMTAAVERGWNTFVFSSADRNLATDWSSIALIQTFFVEDGLLLDSDHKIIATFREVSSPQQLQELQPDSDEGLKNVIIIDLLDWQIIPAENIVAAFQGTDQTVFSVAKNSSEAQIFFEALEHGLGGVVLKVESVEAIIELKGYFDRRSDIRLRLGLTRVCVTKIQTAGIGDRVCVDLCSLMRPGEGLLVGSFARGLFLVHSECLESNYIASRPFRVNAGPVHAYVAIPGGKTCYLSELETGREVLIVNQDGSQRTAIVGRVKIESRPLILIEAKDISHESTTYCILLQNAETVGLVCPRGAAKGTAIPVTALEMGDEVMVRVQGGARHMGIEIQEFITEK